MAGTLHNRYSFHYGVAMGWKPNMSPEQRDRLNASRRRQYARQRLRFGLSYTPKVGEREKQEVLQEKLPTLSAEDALAILQQIEEEDKP